MPSSGDAKQDIANDHQPTQPEARRPAAEQQRSQSPQRRTLARFRCQPGRPTSPALAARTERTGTGCCNRKSRARTRQSSPPTKARSPKQIDRHQQARGAPLDHDEQHQRSGCRDGEGRQGGRRSPAAAGGDKGVGQRAEKHDAQDLAGRIERGVVGIGALIDAVRGQDQVRPRRRGRLIRNTLRQLTVSTRMPPGIGPRMSDTALKDDQPPIACARSSRIGERLGQDRQRARDDQRTGDAL